MQEDDGRIVRRIREGDTEAFRLLVDRHRDRLHAFLARLTGDPQLAEELAQDTFVKAYTGLEGFRGEAEFGTWLLQIGIHKVRDWFRRRGRQKRRNLISLEEYRERAGEAGDPADPNLGTDPVENLQALETRQLMQQALAELPPPYQEVLALKHGEDLPYEQIAGITGASVGTLKVRAHRARSLLLERLHELGWEASGSSGSPRRRRASGGEEDHG